MPPEQAVGESVDQRADVYSLGAIIYHVLAGRPPFVPDPNAKNPSEVLLAQVVAQAPPPLRELAPDTPADLISIVERLKKKQARIDELTGDVGVP